MTRTWMAPYTVSFSVYAKEDVKSVAALRGYETEGFLQSVRKTLRPPRPVEKAVRMAYGRWVVRVRGLYVVYDEGAGGRMVVAVANYIPGRVSGQTW